MTSGFLRCAKARQCDGLKQGKSGVSEVIKPDPLMRETLDSVRVCRCAIPPEKGLPQANVL